MDEIRIGVYVCWCGTNIAKMVDVEYVAEEVSKIHNVIISKNYKYMCSDPGQELIVKDIKEHKLNRIIVSACSPRIHELTFRKALENAGLNPYMFQMANIREQVSWVHSDREKATEKALSLVAGAVQRVKWHESLEKRTVTVHPATLIIGAGISGITAALDIAEAGKKVYLIEKEEQIGGIVSKLELTYPYMNSAQQLINPLVRKVMNHKNIKVFLASEIKDIHGYVGNFESTIYYDNEAITEIRFGNIIVATGLTPFDPSGIEEYQYGRLPDVITSHELEKKLREGPVLKSDGTSPEHIAIIHCVGSRNREHHSYCSRTCCMTAIKYSMQLRTAIPEAKIFELYADMRAIGKGCEELYTYTSKKDIMFLMFDQQNGMPRVSKAKLGDDCEMLINVHEKLSGEAIEVPADMVVLMVSMEAHKTAKEVAHAVGISMCGNEFYIEKHPKLDPVATTTDGVYIVGTCQSPKDIPDSVSQARAAAARILATINFGSVEVEVTTAVVNKDICCGCQTCMSVCPYSAIGFNEEKRISEVNEVLCKGCGTCGATCPAGAINSRHFTDRQILSQIEGVMSTQNQII